MNFSLLAGLFVFSIVSAFTPGPNNLIALATGANHGYRKTLPHILGVCLGFGIMLALMGAGLGALLQAYPLAFVILKYAALAYLLFLAWKIGTSKGFHEGAKQEKPMTFLGSAAFQWINPKAWVAAITVVTNFTEPSAFWPSLILDGVINIVIAFCAVSSWTLFGTVVKRWLSSPGRLKVFNWSMAALLVLSIIPSLLPHS